MTEATTPQPNNSNMIGNYRYTLDIHFKDNSQSYKLSNVCWFGADCDGAMLRVIHENGECQYWPMVNVFNIKVIKREKRT